MQNKCISPIGKEVRYVQKFKNKCKRWKHAECITKPKYQKNTVRHRLFSSSISVLKSTYTFTSLSFYYQKQNLELI